MCTEMKMNRDEFADELLARELSDALGVAVSPEVVCEMIKHRWNRIKVLAHSIHQRLEDDAQGFDQQRAVVNHPNYLPC